MVDLMFTCRMKSVGNRDHGQYAPVSDPAVLEAPTLKALIQKIEEYRDYWALGGGNWVEPKIMQGKRTIGWVSYNGRLWDGPSKMWDQRQPLEIQVQA